MNLSTTIKILLRIYLAFWMLEWSHSLLAYRCAGGNTTSITVDLTDTKVCDGPEAFYAEPEEVNIQLMATDVTRGITSHRCQAFEDADTTRCGFDRSELI